MLLGNTMIFRAYPLTNPVLWLIPQETMEVGDHLGEIIPALLDDPNVMAELLDRIKTHSSLFQNIFRNVIGSTNLAMEEVNFSDDKVTYFNDCIIHHLSLKLYLYFTSCRCTWCSIEYYWWFYKWIRLHYQRQTGDILQSLQWPNPHFTNLWPNDWWRWWQH